MEINTLPTPMSNAAHFTLQKYNTFVLKKPSHQAEQSSAENYRTRTVVHANTQPVKQLATDAYQYFRLSAESDEGFDLLLQYQLECFVSPPRSAMVCYQTIHFTPDVLQQNSLNCECENEHQLLCTVMAIVGEDDSSRKRNSWAKSDGFV